MDLLAQAAAEGTAGGSGTAEVVLFWVFGTLALGSGIGVIVLRNLVHAALMLVLNLLAIAGLFLTLESTFLSIIQVLVYAGAIVVIFLFVIMLLGMSRDDLSAGSRRTVTLAIASIALLGGALLVGIVGPYTSQASVCGEGARSSTSAVACVGLAEENAARETGSVGFLGERMFTRYTFPFELSALLLTVATIGATVLGRRNDPPPDDEVEPLAVDDPSPLPPAEVLTTSSTQAHVPAEDEDPSTDEREA
jgi:NADH-quinone oxidoreductase subunit J